MAANSRSCSKLWQLSSFASLAQDSTSHLCRVSLFSRAKLEYHGIALENGNCSEEFHGSDVELREAIKDQDGSSRRCDGILFPSFTSRRTSILAILPLRFVLLLESSPRPVRLECTIVTDDVARIPLKRKPETKIMESSGRVVGWSKFPRM